MRTLDRRQDRQIRLLRATSCAPEARPQCAERLIAKAHRAQADALKIEAMAKRRLADEYDAAQLRGEVKAPNNAKTTSNVEAVSAANIGLSHKDIHEARQIRDAEETYPGIVKRVLDRGIDEGEEPTRAAVRRAVAPRRAVFASGKQLTNLRKAWREACPAVRQHLTSFRRIGLRLLLSRAISGLR